MSKLSYNSATWLFFNEFYSSWYKGKIHHDVASTLLFEKDINGECIQDDGAFLVRDNLNTPGFFSLTIK